MAKMETITRSFLYIREISCRCTSRYIFQELDKSEMRRSKVFSIVANDTALNLCVSDQI